jgi:hypothetical protein
MVPPAATEAVLEDVEEFDLAIVPSKELTVGDEGVEEYFHTLIDPCCASANAMRFSLKGHAAMLFDFPPLVGVGT